MRNGLVSDTWTGESGTRRQLVSPLERMLDAAVDSERHRLALARQEIAPADERPRPALAVRASEAGAKATNPRHSRPTVPARLYARSGARAEAEPLGQRQASDKGVWWRVCAVALSVLALLAAFLVPVSPTSPARAPRGGELGATTMATPDMPTKQAPERREPVAAVTKDAVTKDELHQIADDGAAAQATLGSVASHMATGSATPSNLDAVAPRFGGVSAPIRSEPWRPSAAPVAETAQTGTQNAAAEKRDDIVTVDDMFGIGGDEPLPPEALDAPSMAQLLSRADKPARDGSAPSALLYRNAPF